MDELIKKIEGLPVGHSVMTYERSIGSNAAEFYTNDLQTLVRRYKAMEEALKGAKTLRGDSWIIRYEEHGGDGPGYYAMHDFWEGGTVGPSKTVIDCYEQMQQALKEII